jgi:Protein of unknown function (DUF4058)
MPSPFPGMDPYLEDPAHWPGVHTFLITAYAELLNKQLRPRYVADIEERLYLTPDDDPAEEQLRVPDLQIERRTGVKVKPAKRNGAATATAEPLVVTTISDDETHEPRIEIRALDTRELVTVMEILSPTNKVPGAEGRKRFLAKRREITSSRVHWVEIDLLRAGVTLDVRRRLDPHDYFVYVSPAELRPKGRVWPLQLQNRLPAVGIPLRAPDHDTMLELQQGLDLMYDRGAYDLKLDYTQDPVPPLPADLAKWANKLLKQKKLR